MTHTGGYVCGILRPLSVLFTLAVFSVASARECCLRRYGGKLYCDGSQPYCCNSETFGDGTNLHCCSSYYMRTSSYYIDEDCFKDDEFPVWGIILLVIGLFLALVTGIALFCCCKKSKGFRGTVNNPAPAPPQTSNMVSYTGPALTPQQPAYNPAHGAFYTTPSQPEVSPAWAMAPPSYSEVMAQGNVNK